jgi:hypothetical protein
MFGVIVVSWRITKIMKHNAKHIIGIRTNKIYCKSEVKINVSFLYAIETLILKNLYKVAVIFSTFPHLWKKGAIVLAMSVCPSVSPSVTSHFCWQENALSVTHSSGHWVIFFLNLIANSMTFHNLKRNPMTFQAWKMKNQIPWLSRFSMTSMHPVKCPISN